MLSAPAAIPAITEVSFPAGFTPADLTFAVRNTTRSEISSDNPARSANASTGAKRRREKPGPAGIIVR